MVYCLVVASSSLANKIEVAKGELWLRLSPKSLLSRKAKNKHEIIWKLFLPWTQFSGNNITLEYKKYDAHIMFAKKHRNNRPVSSTVDYCREALASVEWLAMIIYPTSFRNQESTWYVAGDRDREQHATLRPELVSIFLFCRANCALFNISQARPIPSDCRKHQPTDQPTDIKTALHCCILFSERSHRLSLLDHVTHAGGLLSATPDCTSHRWLTIQW